MLAVVTPFFNPCKYVRLIRNYLQYRDALGCRVFTIELSFDGQFQTPADFKLRGDEENVLWQKEHMINLAVRWLPEKYDRVAWIDADVLFKNPDWRAQTEAMLDDKPFVQPFQTVQLRDDLNTTKVNRAVTCHVAATGQINGKGLSPGFAWAARRELIEKHNIYARHVLGGGDTMLAYALYARWHDGYLLRHMNRAWKRDYLRWALGLWRDVQGNVGTVPGQIEHLYHGTRANRQYVERWHRLAAENFNPRMDVREPDDGPLKWSSDKRKLHRLVRKYFRERREDE